MEPLPTPYDIVPIPYVPYSPGKLEWALVLILSCSALWLVKFIQNRSQKKHYSGPTHAISVTLLALLSAHQRLGRKEITALSYITEISILTRRLLGLLEHLELESSSSRELRELLQQLPQHATPESKAGILFQTVSTLIELENLKYQPATPLLEKTASDFGQKLCQLLERYKLTLTAVPEVKKS